MYNSQLIEHSECCTLYSLTTAVTICTVGAAVWLACHPAHSCTAMYCCSRWDDHADGRLSVRAGMQTFITLSCTFTKQNARRRYEHTHPAMSIFSLAALAMHTICACVQAHSAAAKFNDRLEPRRSCCLSAHCLASPSRWQPTSHSQWQSLNLWYEFAHHLRWCMLLSYSGALTETSRALAEYA